MICAFDNKNNKGRTNNMNKNKLSRFLLSTSVGMIATLGISEISQVRGEQGEAADFVELIAKQNEKVQQYRQVGVDYYVQKDPRLTDAKALELVNKILSKSSGISALNSLGGRADQLFEHFSDILLGGIALTPEHFQSFIEKIVDSSTMRALGVDSVRDLKSPEAERAVVPANITNVDDALYFAQQRRESGEFEAAAGFYLKARDLTDGVNTTKRVECAEGALLMYSEHFIHHVARVTSVTSENVSAAETLLASVKALAEATNTVTAFKRAASCAEELGTAIYDLVLLEKAAKDKLTDGTAIATANAKISSLYVKLYNADIVARYMHENAAGKLSSHEKNAEFVLAAEAMRLAIGALADAHATLSTAVFSNDVTVESKLATEAAAFRDMYTSLADGLGNRSENLKKSAVNAKILLSKLKATWNARSRFASGTSSYTDLDAQYTIISNAIEDARDSGNDQYGGISSDDKHLSAADIIAIRSVEAERLYRVVLDAAGASTIDAAKVTAAVTALQDYVVTASNSSVVDVVTDLDTALKNTLDETKAAAIRKARTESNRTLAGSYGLIAKAKGLQLEKVTNASSTDRISRLESYLKHARLANNKASWDAGVKAADVLLAVAGVANAHSVLAANATDDTDAFRLIKGLALTAKAEALLRDNSAASDDLVAKVNDSYELSAGHLFDAEAVISGIDPNAGGVAPGTTSRDRRISGRDHLRKAFELAVELHNSNTVKQGLRKKWADVESKFAEDKTTVADTALTAHPVGAAFANTSIQQQNGDTWAAILTCFTAGADKEAVKDAIRTALFGTDNAAAGDGIIHGTDDTHANRRAALVADTLAKYFNTVDQAIGAANPTPADHAWASVEGLYNDLKKEYDRVLAVSSNPYVGYAEAAKAFEKARSAIADWAAAEVAGLSSATSATWKAKRDAAGAAYVAAADFEVNRLRAMFATAGRGQYVDAAFDELHEIATTLDGSPELAVAYVTEDILKSLHRRADSLKAAAETYNKTRAANGTAEPEVTANTTSRNAAIVKAVKIEAGVDNDAADPTPDTPLNTGDVNDKHTAAGDGAYEMMLSLINSAYLGLAGFNGAVGLTTFVGERLTAVTNAYRNVNAAWLSDLIATINLDANTGRNQAKRTFLQDKIQDNSDVGTTAGLLATRIFEVSDLYDDTNGAYTANHAARRDVALGYETVLRTLEKLSTTATNLEDHQKYVYSALKANAELARDIDLKPYAPATPATEQQMKDVIAQLSERADLAAAAVSAAYSALRTNTPSNTNKTYKNARAQALTEMTGLIQEGAMDFADIVLKEESAVATADFKAKAAHELGRLLMEKAKAERLRFDNLGVAADKDLARQWFLQAVEATKKEIAAVLSQTSADLMANRNTRLMAAYQQLAEAYKQAIANGADAALVKDQHIATFNYAQILYRTGELNRSAAILEALVETPDAIVVQGTILRELAEQYEAAGKFLKSAKVYKAAALQHVARKDAAGAFDAAENALKAARQINSVEACQAAADAFNAIGATIEFHGRVRAEAYTKAAEALILSELLEDASVAYNASGAEWAKVGDHMQAGNQHEKAAWALSKIASISVDQRIELIQAVEKAAHQLQIAGATTRLEKLVEMAEDHMAKIKSAEDGVSVGKLKHAIVAASGAMYEKALAFQKDGDIIPAQAAESRIIVLLGEVNTDEHKAITLNHLANLYSLQKNHSGAVTRYIEAAEAFANAKKLKDAADAYASAADAAIAGGFGVRINDEILTPLLDISASVRTGGENAGHAEQFDVHMAVVETYRDLAKVMPSAIDKALSEVSEIEKEGPTQKDVIARLAGIKIALLSEKMTALREGAQKADLVSQAKAAFDAVKDLTGETTVATVSVKRYVAVAANVMANMYALSRVIHTTEGAAGLAQIDAFKSVVQTAESAAAAAYKAASTVKMSYDVALAASKEAARTMEAYTKAMVHYVVTEAAVKARADDMIDLREMPERMTKVVDFGVRETLLGILKSREEAVIMQSNFAEVLDATNKVTTYVAALRKSEAAHDSHGNADKAAELKTTIANTATAVKGAQGDLLTQAATAQAKPPVERAAETDKVVGEKTEAIATVVSSAMVAQATLAKTAPAAQVSKEELAKHAESIMTAVLGNGKKDQGIVGDLLKAQGGQTTTAAAAIVSQRG